MKICSEQFTCPLLAVAQQVSLSFSRFAQKFYFAVEFLELKTDNSSCKSLRFNKLIFYLYFNGKSF